MGCAACVSCCPQQSGIEVWAGLWISVAIRCQPRECERCLLMRRWGCEGGSLGAMRLSRPRRVALWSCFGEAALECKKTLQVYDLQGFFCVLADRAGFEPALGYYPKHAFQACDLNHSSTCPGSRPL